jgi:hypothetical protein
MKIIAFDIEEHYSTYEKWCADRGIFPLAPEILTTPGWIVIEDGEPMCCCWSFMSNAVGVFFIASIISNPDISAQQSVRSLDFLMSSVDEIMKELDYTVGFTDTPMSSLSHFLVKKGWTLNHQKSNALMKEVA